MEMHREFQVTSHHRHRKLGVYRKMTLVLFVFRGRENFQLMLMVYLSTISDSKSQKQRGHPPRLELNDVHRFCRNGCHPWTLSMEFMTYIHFFIIKHKNAKNNIKLRIGHLLKYYKVWHIMLQNKKYCCALSACEH